MITVLIFGGLWWSSISEPRWQRDSVQQCTTIRGSTQTKWCHWNILLRWHELVSLGRGQSLFRYFRTKSLQFLLSVCTVCACVVCVLWCLCYTCAVFSVHCVCLFVRVVRLYCLCVVTMVPLFPARHTITYHVVSFISFWMRQSNHRNVDLDL